MNAAFVAPGSSIARQAAVAPARGSAYLHPGQLFAADTPHVLTTILGSCVAVCLWDPRLRQGGINHFMLPEDRAGGQSGPRFGDHAIRELLARMAALGSMPGALQAKLFGGACVVEAFRERENHLGFQNAELARRLIRQAGIEIVAEDLGGTRGRKLIFHTDDGTALVRPL